MKNLLIPALAIAALLAAPDHASAKARGCGYRLAGLADARAALDRALAGKGDVGLARAQLSRAISKAHAEGCPIDDRRASRRPVHRSHGVVVYPQAFHEHRHTHLKRHVVDAKLAHAKRLKLEHARVRARIRFDTLVHTRHARPLTWAERRELAFLHKRWGF